MKQEALLSLSAGKSFDSHAKIILREHLSQVDASPTVPF